MLITVYMGLCGYGNEWEEDVEVTEQEYERLRIALSTGRDFRDCEEVKDIYDRIVDITDESATEIFRSFDDVQRTIDGFGKKHFFDKETTNAIRGAK